MGKRKFSNEEETRIVEFLKKWRQSNPYALEWPIDEVRQGAWVRKFMIYNCEHLGVLI